jgi:hypothetical protein
MTLRIAHLAKIICAIVEGPLTGPERSELNAVLAALIQPDVVLAIYNIRDHANEAIDQSLAQQE